MSVVLTRGETYKYYSAKAVLTVVYIRSFKNAWSGKMYYEFGLFAKGVPVLSGRVILTQSQVASFVMYAKTSDERVIRVAKEAAEKERAALDFALRRKNDVVQDTVGVGDDEADVIGEEQP